MRTRRQAFTAIAALAGLLALGSAACGDDEESSDESTDEAADEEVIEDAIITIDDLPEGFEETEPDDDSDDTQEVEEACQEAAGLDPDELDDNEVVDGEEVEFQREVAGTSLIGFTVSITSFEDPQLAADSLEALSDDVYLDCSAEGITAIAAEEGQDISDLTIEAIDPLFEGDAAGSARVEFDTQGFPTVLEQHLVLVGRFGISLQVVTVNEDVDEDLVAELLETMADRIEDAVDS